MCFRSILSGTLTILLLSGAAVQADERAGIFDVLKPVETTADNGLARIGLPKLFGGNEKPSETVQMAQAGDPRITALEEQVRALSGTIEELNFQILQMQEQMRKMQEDNEFRFQELEGKKTDAGAPADNNVAAAPAAPAVAEQQATVEEDEQAVDVPMEPEILVDNGTGDPAEVPSGNGGADGLGAPPKIFGTITFDENGNVTGGDTTQSVTGAMEQTSPSIVQQSAPDQPAETQVAALPSTDNPDELYRNAYEFILSGDYGTAEAGFREHIERFPENQKAADAHFWLGEAQLGQKKHRDAAETFLAANKQYPSAKKAPDMLLKLGVSLVGLDQRDVACATFAEIGKRYPSISGALKERVKQEQALAAC